MIENRHLPVVKITPDGSLNAYIRKVNSIPLLTLEEENELTERLWQNMDFAAAQKLVLAHLRLVVKIAQTFRSYDLPMQDMISEGNIGLMKAVQKFSPNVGCRLATYAAWWIRSTIQEYILNSLSLLKMSTRAMKQKLFYKPSERQQSDGDKNICMSPMISLDETNDNTALIEVIPSNETCHADVIIDNDEKNGRQNILQQGIDSLNERERNILYRRRLKEEPDKLSDIAKEYGVSQERIRQIEQKIIEKLKGFVAKSEYA
jgi:RNA polymerase sigma-32 factor